MHYPWWYVPLLTSPMLIAIVSVLHVIVSHYAVGGGIFLALETHFAYRVGNKNYLDYLRNHAWFFILVTVVFGAITGVGIWWTIGLASPLATETLIHIFVFGWGMEYVFFVIEISSAFAFYYLWGKIDSKQHIKIGWIYALSAWISLVLISGITAFMLNSGNWLRERNFWVAFLNPQFIPQVIARTGAALILASVYVYLHASIKLKDEELRQMVFKRSGRPLFLGTLFLIIGGSSWYLFLPHSAKAALLAASVINVLLMMLIASVSVLLIMIYLGPYKNPQWVNSGFAIMLFLFGIGSMALGEYIREAVRKPYIVYNVVLSNQLLTDEVSDVKQRGYLESGIWTRRYIYAYYPDYIVDNKIDESKLLSLPQNDRINIGHVLFQYHCNDCHSDVNGYIAVGHLTTGWTPEIVRMIVLHPEKTHFFMPPWLGTNEEAELLVDYIMSMQRAFPPGMYYGNNKENINEKQER